MTKMHSSFPNKLHYLGLGLLISLALLAVLIISCDRENNDSDDTGNNDDDSADGGDDDTYEETWTDPSSGLA